MNMTDGAHTSRQYSVCGAVHPGSRPPRAAFRCHRCGHIGNADLNAGVDIAARPLSTGLLASAPPIPGERWSHKSGKGMLSHTAACPRQKKGVVECGGIL
ncbi:MAG: transposase [Methanomicrobiales archaeon]|nr:transposase [Methanomicrobiales archaeon]